MTKLGARCSLTAKRRLCFSAAFLKAPTISLFGPVATEFQRGCYFEFHKSNPSWCTAMLQKYFAPAFL